MNASDRNRGDDLLPYAVTAEEVLAASESSIHGISQAEAAARLIEFGPNRLPEPGAPGVISLFMSQFLSPLIYVLLAAAVVSLLLEEFADAGFISAVLLVNAIIGTVQEYHAHRSAEALRSLVSSRALIMRDGESCEINAAELVPGDIVLLEGQGTGGHSSVSGV